MIPGDLDDVDPSTLNPDALATPGDDFGDPSLPQRDSRRWPSRTQALMLRRSQATMPRRSHAMMLQRLHALAIPGMYALVIPGDATPVTLSDDAIETPGDAYLAALLVLVCAKPQEVDDVDPPTLGQDARATLSDNFPAAPGNGASATSSYDDPAPPVDGSLAIPGDDTPAIIGDKKSSVYRQCCFVDLSMGNSLKYSPDFCSGNTGLGWTDPWAHPSCAWFSWGVLAPEAFFRFCGH